jgi:glutathionylspermidine synthase
MNSSFYHEKRKQLFDPIEDFWPDLYGEEYALYDIYQTDREVIKKIQLSTERIGHIFFKTATLLRHAPDEVLTEMGFPKESLSFLRFLPVQAETVIARLDLVPSGETFKCLELNSDTPTFIKEVYDINERICQEFQLDNPNQEMEALLRQALRNNIQATKCISEESFNIVFTAHEENIEDRYTALYLQKLSGFPARFIPLHRLQIVKGEGLYDEDGHRIDVLYRQTFPIENLLLDFDSSGQPIGQWLIELVELEKLAIINPPSAFLLQNKSVQAVIWGLHVEKDAFYTAEEHEWIEEHFLPTYLEPDPFLQEECPYVQKPVFGREGDTVQIYDGTGQLQLEDTYKTYQDYLPIYQKYIELPKVQYSSEKGVCQGHLIFGSFLISGQAGAIGCRVGDPITNNLSYFLPIGLRRGRDNVDLTSDFFKG